VRVTYECFEGMIHGFVTMSAALAAADHALYRGAQGLRLAFAAAPRAGSVESAALGHLGKARE